MSDTYVIPAPPLVTLPISGETAVFPVRRVYCVGRNYAEHAREMGHSGKEPPFFFQKNPDNLVTDGVFPYPSRTADLHHEVELVVALAKGGRDIHDETGLTTVFVTHDQDEAMALADLVVVMSMGRIEQIGKPQDIRTRPATAFVREFVGV